MSFLCEISGWGSLSALSVALLVSIILWRGGSIDKIKIPYLFEVTLQRPVIFEGSVLWLLPGGTALFMVLFVAAAAGPLELCRGSSNWVLVGTWTDATWSNTDFSPLPNITKKNDLVDAVITASSETATSVQLYAEPDSNTQVIGKLSMGDQVEVLETRRPGNAEFWARVRVD